MKAFLLMVVFAFSCAASPAMAQGLGEKTQKLPATGRVLQVLPEGLLFSGGSSPYLIVGHPDQNKLADGSPVNCYVAKTEKTFQYTDVRGSVRTVRVFRYLNKRIGKR